MHLSNNITTQNNIHKPQHYILVIQCRQTDNNCLFVCCIGKNVGTEYPNESINDWHSDTLFPRCVIGIVCYCSDLQNFLTFKTFWPSKLSDLQNFLTFKTFWPSCGCSESTCTKLYNRIINPRHQADNYHPNMLKPQRYTLAIL